MRTPRCACIRPPRRAHVAARPRDGATEPDRRSPSAARSTRRKVSAGSVSAKTMPPVVVPPRHHRSCRSTRRVQRPMRESSGATAQQILKVAERSAVRRLPVPATCELHAGGAAERAEPVRPFPLFARPGRPRPRRRTRARGNSASPGRCSCATTPFRGADASWFRLNVTASRPAARFRSEAVGKPREPVPVSALRPRAGCRRAPAVRRARRRPLPPGGGRAETGTRSAVRRSTSSLGKAFVLALDVPQQHRAGRRPSAQSCTDPERSGGRTISMKVAAGPRSRASSATFCVPHGYPKPCRRGARA